MYDYIRPKLKPHGLEWVDFQVMRATHASIGHRLKLDPKVTADRKRLVNRPIKFCWQSA
jgi:hypothetical protein